MSILKHEMAIMAEMDDRSEKENLASAPWTLDPYWYLKNMHTPEHKNPKILFVDDDPLLCKKLERKAKKMDVDITICKSVSDIMKLPSQPDFDIAVLDYFFGELTAFQLSHLLGREIPIILISNTEARKISNDKWPPEIRSFIPKSKGLDAILSEAIFNTPEGRSRSMAAAKQIEEKKEAPPTFEENPYWWMPFMALIAGAVGLSLLYFITTQDRGFFQKTWQWDMAPFSPRSGFTQTLPAQNVSER